MAKIIFTAVSLLVMLGSFARLMASQDLGVIEGRVVDSFGSALAGVKVEVAADTGDFQLATLTDGGGCFRISKLPSGHYKVSASLSGFVTERRQINVEEGKSQELSLGLLVGHPDGKEPIQLSGTVLESRKQPVVNATIVISNAFNDGLTYTTKTDRKGRYRIEIYYPGRYNIRASKPGFTDTSEAIVLLGQVPSQRKKANLVMVPH